MCSPLFGECFNPTKGLFEKYSQQLSVICFRQCTLVWSYDCYEECDRLLGEKRVELHCYIFGVIDCSGYATTILDQIIETFCTCKIGSMFQLHPFLFPTKYTEYCCWTWHLPSYKHWRAGGEEGDGGQDLPQIILSMVVGPSYFHTNNSWWLYPAVKKKLWFLFSYSFLM